MSSIAVLQPSYLPWIGYFEQIDRVDHFIFYDDVQYTKNDWRNRNRIKHAGGIMWLSVPVRDPFAKAINEVEIDNTQPWRRKHLNALSSNYRQCPFFEEVYPLVEQAFIQNHDKLSALNVDIITNIMEYLQITTSFHLASQLNVGGDKNSRLINFCRHFDAKSYYSGAAAREYLACEAFEEAGIDVVFQSFEHRPYSQQFGDFVPFLSIIDLLFNHGRESLDYIRMGNE